MEPTRRELLAGVGVGAAAGVAGCTSGVSAFAAAGAPLSESVQEDTGYTEHRSVEETITRRYQVFVFDRSVEVTNVIHEYDRAIDLGLLGRIQAAVFATLASPKVEILTRTFNPLGGMTTLEIAEIIQQRYDTIDDVEPDADIEVDVAGETTTATRFTAEARLVGVGERVGIYLYVTEAVAVGGDFVVTLAAHPRLFGAAEDTVRALTAGVEVSDRGEGT